MAWWHLRPPTRATLAGTNYRKRRATFVSSTFLRVATCRVHSTMHCPATPSCWARGSTRSMGISCCGTRAQRRPGSRSRHSPVSRGRSSTCRGREVRTSGSYVLLKRVVIRNGGGNNLHIAPESGEVRDVVIRKTKIHGLVWGPGAAIKLNRANDYKVRRVWLIDNNVSQAISNAIIDGVAVRKVAARGNKIHDNVVGSHGIFFKGGSSKILIEENRIWGIRQNAALQLGGNTGPNFWDPGFPLWEGVDQVARRNVIFDFDDSVFEIRGVLRGEIYENEVDSQDDVCHLPSPVWEPQWGRSERQRRHLDPRQRDHGHGRSAICTKRLQAGEHWVRQSDVDRHIPQLREPWTEHPAIPASGRHGCSLGR